MEDYVMVIVYVLAGILGLCIGSFLNVVIYRVPNKMSLAKPNSHCTSCGYELKWYDNIPVLSYLIPLSWKIDDTVILYKLDHFRNTNDNRKTENW